jgi:small subunit ribosomal protein S18
MPPKGKTDGPKKRSARAQREAAQKCKTCETGIDYKDLDTLQKLVTQQGKLYSRKRSGLCAKCQRDARVAIKRSRFMALMPYIG